MIHSIDNPTGWGNIRPYTKQTQFDNSVVFRPENRTEADVFNFVVETIELGGANKPSDTMLMLPRHGDLYIEYDEHNPALSITQITAGNEHVAAIFADSLAVFELPVAIVE
jgi:hypothetical protein